MSTISRSLTINTPPQRVYDAYLDLSTWPTWNPHLRQVSPLDETPLAVGSRARVATKLGLSSVWAVTRLEPGRSFAWEADLLPGLHVLFDHIADPATEGSRATLQILTSGPLGFLGALIGPLYARNLDRSLRELRGLLEGERPAEAAKSE